MASTASPVVNPLDHETLFHEYLFGLLKVHNHYQAWTSTELERLTSRLLTRFRLRQDTQANPPRRRDVPIVTLDLNLKRVLLVLHTKAGTAKILINMPCPNRFIAAIAQAVDWDINAWYERNQPMEHPAAQDTGLNSSRPLESLRDVYGRKLETIATGINKEEEREGVQQEDLEASSAGEEGMKNEEEQAVPTTKIGKKKREKHGKKKKTDKKDCNIQAEQQEEGSIASTDDENDDLGEATPTNGPTLPRGKWTLQIKTGKETYCNNEDCGWEAWHHQKCLVPGAGEPTSLCFECKNKPREEI